MKTRVFSETDHAKLEDKISDIVSTFNSGTKYNIFYSTCPASALGGVMYSALIIWG